MSKWESLRGSCHVLPLLFPYQLKLGKASMIRKWGGKKRRNGVEKGGVTAKWIQTTFHVELLMTIMKLKNTSKASPVYYGLI